MTQTPTDRNQALRDAAKVARNMTTGTEGDPWDAACECIADRILAMQEPASEQLEVGRKIAEKRSSALKQLASEPAPASAPHAGIFDKCMDDAARKQLQDDTRYQRQAFAPASDPICCGWEEAAKIAEKVAENNHIVANEYDGGSSSLAYEMACDKIAETIRARAQPCRCGELREALTRCRDRFFPADQPERDRDLDWDLVNNALASAASDEWQDIESAPKDGRDILVYCADTGEAFVAYYYLRDRAWAFAIQADGRRIECLPTHWMPLPATTPRSGES